MAGFCRRLKWLILFFRVIEYRYILQGLYLLAGLTLYFILSRVWPRGVLLSHLASRAVTVKLDRTRFRIPFFPGDLGCIFECYVLRSYEACEGFAPRPGDTCLDIGANIGAVTLTWLRTNPTGTIIAVEPHPLTYKRLVTNVRLNGGDNIECVRAAVSSECGELQIDTQQCLTMARVLAEPGARGELVRSITLDELARSRRLERIHLCKIDVEGHEAEVLKGAQGTLARIDKLEMEFHSIRLRESVKELLAPHFVIRNESTHRVGLIHAVNRRLTS
jgi:FkbM family methyltransferase